MHQYYTISLNPKKQRERKKKRKKKKKKKNLEIPGFTISIKS